MVASETMGTTHRVSDRCEPYAHAVKRRVRQPFITNEETQSASDGRCHIVPLSYRYVIWY